MTTSRRRHRKIIAVGIDFCQLKSFCHAIVVRAEKCNDKTTVYACITIAYWNRFCSPAIATTLNFNAFPDVQQGIHAESAPPRPVEPLVDESCKDQQTIIAIGKLQILERLLALHR